MSRRYLPVHASFCWLCWTLGLYRRVLAVTLRPWA